MDREDTFTKRDVSRVHQLAMEIYIAGFTNSSDNGYVTVSDAWDYAVRFHSHALSMWECYDFPEDEEKENG